MSSLNDKVLESSVLYKFLGMEDVADLRRLVKEAIIEEIKKDLRNSSYYIVSPDDINKLLGGIVEQACDDIKEEYKSQIRSIVEKKLEGIVNL